jgi:hypothetical protein
MPILPPDKISRGEGAAVVPPVSSLSPAAIHEHQGYGFKLNASLRFRVNGTVSKPTVNRSLWAFADAYD